MHDEGVQGRPLDSRLSKMSILLMCGLALLACSDSGRSANSGIFIGKVIGPPEGSEAKLIVRAFPDGANVAKAETTVEVGSTFRFELPNGVWDIRSDDGKACIENVTVQPGATHRTDLLWPAEGCTGGSPSPPATHPTP